MDYQQSIKNLNHLKNFVRAWTNCHIFFFFYSESECVVEIYESDFMPEQQKKIDENLRSGFPYGYIYNEKSGEEILYYRDDNITVEYDFFSDRCHIFYCYDPVDRRALQRQFSQLIDFLKNK